MPILNVKVSAAMTSIAIDVYVQDVRAVAYGHGGKTQELRSQRGS